MTALTMSEAELQAAVIDLARLLGYLVFHPRKARSSSGRWMTALAGDAGFPDLTLAGHGRVVFVELKSDRGRLTGEQQAWADACAAGAEHFVWRPADWLDGTILRVLKGDR